MDKGKKESVNKPKNKSIHRILLLVIISIVLLIIIVLVFVFFFFYSSDSLKETYFNESKEINSSYLSNDMRKLYIKLETENTTKVINDSLVKIMMRSFNGTVYYYNVNKTTSELILEEISIPKSKNVLGIINSKKDYNYNIKISLSDISGLSSFYDISQIKVFFESNQTTAVVPNVTKNETITPNKTVPKRRVTPSQSSTSSESTTSESSSSSTTGDTNSGNTNTCTETAWQNHSEYRCSSGIREIYQERNVCPSGEQQERWVTSNCNSSSSCYDGLNAPLDKCINNAIYCIDSDNGTNITVFGFVNISSNIHNDLCYQNKTLTEYYCNFNGTGFTASNNTLNCTHSCIDGECIVCNDNDLDNYSSSGGTCGSIDCNDTNSNINPEKQEICQNSIDENCDGITTCINLENSLIAYYKFNDTLSDNLATDETGLNNAGCTNCPLYNETSGLNASGSYEFNGVSSSIAIPSGILNNNTYSISLWINPKTTSSDEMIIYANAGSITKGVLSLWFDSNRNSLYLYNNYGLEYQTSIDSIAPNEWTNIIIVYDSTNLQVKLYANGVLKTTLASFNKNPEPSLILIGSKIDQKYFKGNIAEIRFYNRTITSEEISNLSSEFSSTSLPSLSLFDEKIDNTMIFYGIILLIVLIIIFVLFYLLARIYKSE